MMTQLSVGSVMIGALGGMVGSITSQAFSGNGLNFGKILQAGALGALTAGVMAGTGLANLQGLQDLGRTIGTGGAVSMGQLGQVLVKIVERGVVSAAINTAVSGGSFGSALTNSMISDLGMVGAGAIGVASADNTSMLAEGSPGYVLAHAGLGCALSAAKGTGCASGAIGGAVSAMTANSIATAATGGQGVTDQGQLAAIVTATSLLGGAAAGLLGQNALAAMTAAQNETLNNTCADGHHCGEDRQKLNEHTYTHQILPQGGGPIDEEQAGETIVAGKGTPPAGMPSNTGGVNLASPDRTNHILNGDATGGGHLWPGAPGKSAFPQSWSPTQIMNDVSDIATDPAIAETVQSNGRIVKNGTRDGIDIRVVIEPVSKGGGIVTAYPTNVPRNPK
ncbi:hypothetical protein DF132_30460 [Burkholderia cenocepacia]|nr:hypothetical protein DF132_30460 [Burkholderia cenocepacia]